MRLPPILAEGRFRLFAWLVAFGLAEAMAAVAAALLARFTFDTLVGDARAVSPADLPWLLAGFAGVAAAVVAVRTWEGAVAEALGQSYVASLRRRLFGHLLDLPMCRLQQRRRGHLMLRFIGDLNAVRLWVSQGLGRITLASVTLCGALGALAVFNLGFAGLAAGALLATGAVMALLARPLSERIRLARRRRSQLAGNLGEKLSDIAVVQAFGRSRKEYKRLGRQNERLIRAMVRRTRLASLVRVLPEAALTLTTGLVVLLGTVQVSRDATTPGTIVAALTILGLLAAPLSHLARVFEYWRNFGVARQKIREFLSIPPRRAETAPQDRLRAERGALRFEQVGARGLRGPVDLNVEPGATVALVGPNGAGKSTLLMLAAGLLAPERGRVLVDGQDLQACAPDSLSRAIGVVSPDLPLLRGTIAWNLRYRRPRAPDDEVASVCALCDLEQAIADLPGGMDTRVQEGGRNLPAGLRQRICLARALVGAPAVLLLDEVDAELDRAGRRALDRLLRAGAATVIMATHDLERVLLADRLWYLQGGRIVESGAPAALLGREGPTTRLFGLRPGQVASLRARAAAS